MDKRDMRERKSGNSTSWSDAPKWAKFRAMNRDGIWMWHENLPEYDSEYGIWVNSGASCVCVDPRQSLSERPLSVGFRS